MGKQSNGQAITYRETFIIPDLWWQPYPVYHVSEKGNLYSLKSILYPNPRSIKKFTRNKQLKNRSMQAKMMDMLLNVGYFDPLPVAREFPFIIQNGKRLKGMKGGYFLLDYFFPTVLGGKGLAVELDSEYHKKEKDAVRDLYLLKNYGIRTFRISHLERPEVQKGKFKELCQLLRSEEAASGHPKPFNFSETIHEYLKGKDTKLLSLICVDEEEN